MKTSGEIESDLDNLAREIRQGSVVLFVGAGLSLNARPKPGTNARMLNWAELKRRFADELGWDPQTTDRMSAPRLIQMFESKFSLERRNQILREAIPDRDMHPGDLHSGLVDFDWSAIVTTNIDTLLERAYAQVSRACTPIVYESDLTHVGSNPIYKFHGSIEAQETWIFSEREYYQDVRPLFVDKLRSIFAEKTVVFLGYGVNDPDLDAILYYIHRRVGHYQRKPILLALEGADSNRLYWRDRSINLITDRDLNLLKQTIPGGAIMTAPMGNQHAELLASFVEVLRKAVDRDPLNTDRRARWLWKETRLKPAIEKHAEGTLGLILSFERGSTILNDSKSKVIARLTESAQSPEWRADIVEFCKAVQKTLSLREGAAFLPFATDLEEVLWGLDEGRASDRMLSLFPMGMAAALADPALLPPVVSVLQALTDSLWNRLGSGRLHGLSDSSLERVLIITCHFRRKGNRSAAAPFPEVIWQSLRALRLITGTGLAEDGLLRRLSRLARSGQLSPERLALVEYRKAIACIYLNRWSDVEALLNQTDRFPGWREEWTAFLFCELGQSEKADQIYRSRMLKGENRPVRYVATQARWITGQLLARDPRDLRKIQEAWETQQTENERLARLEAEARAAGEYLEDFDFLDKGTSRLHQRLLEAAFKAVRKRAEASRNHQLTFGGSSSVPSIHEEVLRRAINGLPLAQLRTDKMRDALAALLTGPEHITSMIELQAILPVFEDFSKERPYSIMAVLAWKNPNAWRKIQAGLLDQYEHLIDFILRSLMLRRDGSESPIHDRFASLSGLIGYATYIFSKPSLQRLQILLGRVFENVGLFSPAGEVGGISALGRMLDAVFMDASVEERARFLERIPAHFFFSHWGQSFLGFLGHHIDTSVWEALARESREKILDTLSQTLPTDSYSCMQLLRFAGRSGDTRHPILDAFASGLEAYRQSRLAKIDEDLARVDPKRQDATWIDYSQMLQKERDELKVQDGHVFRQYRGLLGEINPGSPSVPPVEDLPAWVQRKRSEMPGSLSSAQLDGLNVFVIAGIPIEHQPMLEDLLVDVVQRIRAKFTRSPLDFFVVGPLLSAIGFYYLATEQFDKWMGLWEDFGVFYGQWPDSTYTERLRRREEEAGMKISYTERLGHLLLRLASDDEKSGLLHFFYAMHESLTRVLDSDLRLLRFLWAAPSVRAKTIELPLHLADRLFSVDAEAVSNDLPSVLFQLLHVDDLEILPVRAQAIDELLQKTKSTWQADASLAVLAESMLEKIRVLDFPHVPQAG